MSSITEHRNAHLSDANMHEVKGFPSAAAGYSYIKNIRGQSEWVRTARQENVISAVNGYDAPLTEVDGDVYAVSSPLLDLNNINWQSGTTVRFTFTSGYTNIYAVGNYLQISGETTKTVHNGVWLISAVNASYLEVTNVGVTDATNDVAASVGSGYVSHQDYDPENLANSQTIPRVGLVKYFGTLDLWYGNAFEIGDEFYDVSKNGVDRYNGSAITDNAIYSVKVSMSAAQILAAEQVSAIEAPGAGKAIEVLRITVKYTYVSVVYNVSRYIEAWTSTARTYHGRTADILTVAASCFVKGGGDVSASTEIVENQAVYVKSDSASATGNGTAIVYLTYRIITL